MARCTAPYNGHRTSSGAANCPACGSRGRYRGYSSYSSPSYPTSYNYPSSGNSVGSSSTGSGGGGRTKKPRWSSPSSGAYYTSDEIRTLDPVRKSYEERAKKPDLRDIFLCHAWDDRNGTAKELHDMLEARGASVWFSEKDVALGSLLLREIDKGLANSRIGIVLVTPAFLRRVDNEGIAEKELSALLARDLLIPVVHDTTFEELRETSPLLGSRSGLSTSEQSLDDVALKLVELVSDTQ
jgi:hypothetical protein